MYTGATFFVVVETHNSYLFSQQKNSEFNVKKFSLSIVGDFCRNCPNSFTGRAEIVLQLVAKYLVLSSDPKQEDNSLILCNNAAWATNMLLHTYPTEIAQHLDTLAKQFVELLLTKTVIQLLIIKLSNH